MEGYLEGGSEEKAAKKKKKQSSGYEFAGENGFAEFGGYMDAKISKLDQQFQASKDPSVQESNLFSGISIFVNGLTNPSSGELKLIMLKHGGTFHTYERSHTDFIIASNLPDVKIRNHSVSKTIIRPEWITRCLEEKRIVDYTPYLLVTKRNHQQPRITFQEGKSSTKSHPDDSLANGLQSLNQSLANKVSVVLKRIPDAPQLAQPQKNQARTANDPNFLSEFYNNSRLHHISTLGATFKQHISDLREKHSGQFPARDTLLQEITCREEYGEKSPSFIMHIDMDCFFVSVGLRSRPDLIGHPVAVTHSKGNSVHVRPGSDLNYEQKAFHERYGNKFGNGTEQLMNADKTQSLSEIASCSYEARAKGVKNGMFMGSALKLCPELKTIQYDFEGYKEVAFTLYNTIAQYTLDIEAVSCDEMYVDLTSLLRTTQIPVMDFITHLRDEIKLKTGCPCSAGIGSNRIQARMATKKAKPNGQFYLSPDEVIGYFRDIQITDLPGVGRSTTVKLERKEWKTCGDLQKVPVSLLQQEFGKKFGETLHQLSTGRDDKPLNFGQVRKSVSAEVNYGIRFKEQTELEAFLSQLCQEVQSRLIEARRKGKCVTLKYMVRAADAPVETAKFMGHGVCDVVNKSQALNEFTNDAEVIKRTVLQLNSEMNVPPEELRGIGIQVTKLDGTAEGSAAVKDNRLKEMFSKVQQKKRTNENEFPHVAIKPFQIPILHPISISTPEKDKKDKSPEKKKTKSPAKRGRPPKKNAVKTKAITELMRPVEDDLDEDVLNELPEEFRAEAIRSHRILKRFNSDPKINPPAQKTINQEKQEEIKSTPAVDEEFLAALPPDIRREVELEMGIRSSTDTTEEQEKKAAQKKVQEVPKVSPENVFVQSNWRDLLAAWIETSDEPEDVDIQVIVDSWRELIDDQRMVDVYSQLRYFSRIVNSSTKCGWHRKYSVIMADVQQVVLCNVGRKIAIHEVIQCNNCEAGDAVMKQ